MIAGKKVILRLATLADRRQIFEWLAASDTTSRMMGPPDFPDMPVPAWAEFLEDYNPEYFHDLDPDSGRCFIIEAGSEQVGQINYNEIDRSTGTVELDIWLGGSRHCNKGYGTDAINTLCDYLAMELHCTTCILAPSARNKAAIIAYEKCGFQVTDAWPEHFIPDYHDTVVMIKKIGNAQGVSSESH